MLEVWHQDDLVNIKAMSMASCTVVYRQPVCKRTNYVIADILRPVFRMLTEDNDCEVGRQTQSALTPHLASLIMPDRVLCSEQVRSPKRDLMFVMPYPRAILYTDVGLSIREL
jgi:hypothetical protein